MASSFDYNFNFKQPAAQSYTANSVAKSHRNTTHKINGQSSSDKYADYNKNTTEKELNNTLKDYKKSPVKYTKNFNLKQLDTDYKKTNITGYHKAYYSMQMSKAVSAYSFNNFIANDIKTNTFAINV